MRCPACASNLNGKIALIFATRCQILRPKCTKFSFGLLGNLLRSFRPLAEFKGPYLEEGKCVVEKFRGGGKGEGSVWESRWRAMLQLGREGSFLCLTRPTRSCRFVFQCSWSLSVNSESSLSFDHCGPRTACCCTPDRLATGLVTTSHWSSPAAMSSLGLHIKY